MRLLAVSLVLVLVLLGLVLELMRRRRLREKYAAIWLVVAAGAVVLTVVPSLLDGLAGLVGIQTPSNLLFLLALLVLLAISLQLSGEVGQLEEQTRVLAEEVGMARLERDRARTAHTELAARVAELEQRASARAEQPRGAAPGEADRDVHGTRRAG
ncbi:hypothetical protein GCM10027047_16290 [Rhodococcus aerolatus]